MARSTTILLLRHPEKDTATGNLTGAGKNSLLRQLQDTWREGEYDSLRLYASPLPRGQQCIPVLERFATSIGLSCAVITEPRLYGLGHLMDGKALKDWLNPILGTTDAMVTDGRPSIEPSSQDFEVRGNTYLIRHYYDKPCPGFPHTRREHGAPIGEMVRDIARLPPTGARTLVVVIGHSGIIEDWLKSVYLDNHPDITDSTTVGVEDLGGLLDFGEGPTITITHDGNGRPTARLNRGPLHNLQVPLDF